MREIKFRVWNAGNNEWLRDRDISIFPDGSISIFGNTNLSLELFPLYWPLITIMQFTGLKDKNRKDIYDGDILHQDDYSNWIVCWYNTGFHIYNYCNPAQKFLLPTIVERTVIGNIYENPELDEK